MLIYEALVCLFLLQFNIPLSKYTTTCLSVLLMVDICVVSKSLLLQCYSEHFCSIHIVFFPSNLQA